VAIKKRTEITGFLDVIEKILDTNVEKAKMFINKDFIEDLD